VEKTEERFGRVGIEMADMIIDFTNPRAYRASLKEVDLYLLEGLWAAGCGTGFVPFERIDRYAGLEAGIGSMNGDSLVRSLSRLRFAGYVERDGKTYRLTGKGEAASRDVVREVRSIFGAVTGGSE